VNLLGNNTDAVKKHINFNAGREVRLEINAEITEYMLLARRQNARQNRDIKIANRFFENVPKFEYLGITVAIQNLTEEEVKRRLSSGNACYHSVHLKP
jgi:hypothetical protein